MYIWGVRQAIVMILESIVFVKLLEATGCQQGCNPRGGFQLLLQVYESMQGEKPGIDQSSSL